MQRPLFSFLTVTILTTASPAFAAHDHGGSHHEAAQPPVQHEQSSKETEALLESCARKSAAIQRRINNLRDGLGRKDRTAVVEELKKLEQKLKEADEIVRPLQVF